ncbi:MAG: hypothetical protein HYX66_02580 [Ignavibacteria bacterium]|nr:hypothetical protein [Ignavibacteria bacterium]
MKTNNDFEDIGKELKSFEKLIGKNIHDEWVDVHTKNLSADVVNALNTKERGYREYLRYALPAALAVVLLVVVILKPSFKSSSLDTHTDSVYRFVSESEVKKALLAEISDDEAVDMIAVEQNLNPIILTDKDIDNLLKDL